MRVHACTNIRRVSAPYLTVCAYIVWSHDHLEYVLIVQVNHCHEEQLAKLKHEMKRIMASKDEQIARLQLGNKELINLQAMNQQQVKQYKKQVDSYKAELERCQKELERCQGELLEVDAMGAMVLCGWSCACIFVWGMHMCTCMYVSTRVGVCTCTCRCVLVCVMCTLVHSCIEKDAVGGTQGLRSKIST